jgi:hypothetical protein
MTRATTFIIAMIAFLGGVAALTAAPCSVSSPFLTCGAFILVQHPPTHFILDVSDLVDLATLDASDFTVNGIPANNVTLSNGDLTIEFIFNTSPAVPGLNTMHIPHWRF